MQAFKKLFMSIAPYHSRYKVWNDFIIMSGIAIHNAIPTQRDNDLEQQYRHIVKQYKNEDVWLLKDLFHLLPPIFEKGIDDHLGALYMQLEISNSDMGQFFTPFQLSVLCAQLSFDIKEIEKNGFITAHEPSIGGGGMVLALAKVMSDKGYNYQRQLYVHGIELDSTVAWMAYIQLSLFGIPAEIDIGNTLTLNLSRKLLTPMYYLGGWEFKVPCYFDSVTCQE